VTYSNDTAANYRFDGLSWSTFAVDKGMFGPILHALTGASGSSLLAVGENGALFRYDGKSWWRLDKGVSVDRGSQANTGLVELAVFNGSAFVSSSFQSSYTCCYEGMLTRQGGSWVQSSMPESYAKLSGTGPTNLWTVDGKNAYRFDGATWSGKLPFTSTSLYKTPSIAAVSSTDVWVVIADKTIHHDGSSWTSVPNPISATTTVLRSVAAFDATHVWAGGDAGTLLFYDGSSWSAKVSGVSSAVNAIHAYGASLAYAAGDFGVIRWDGSAWQPTARTTAAQRVWAESATSYWVLTGSELKRWDGSQLVDMAPWRPAVQFALSDVRGAGGDIFVAGSDAVILKKQ
jgi:hypothetical protein